MTSGYFISGPDFVTLPDGVQSSILALLAKSPPVLEESIPAEIPQPAAAAPDASEVDENFMELSLSQAREFLSGRMDPKTRSTIEIMVSGPTPQFRLKDIVDKLGLERASKLRGVWAGITRRTHSYYGADAYLIDWAKSDAVYDDAGVYIDQGGEMTEMSYRSFRRALGIEKA